MQLGIERRRCARRPTTRRRHSSETSRRSSRPSRKVPARLKQRWEARSLRIAAIRAPGLEGLPTRIEQAEREADYATAAELKYGTLKELNDRMTEQEAALIACRAPERCSRRKSARTTSPRSSGRGPASRSAACSRARPASSPATWKSGCTSGWSARTRPSRPSPTRSAAPGPDSRTTPADRLVPVPRPDRRRQDRARPALAEFMFDDEDALVAST